jgi:hypothetical protein
MRILADLDQAGPEGEATQHRVSGDGQDRPKQTLSQCGLGSKSRRRPIVPISHQPRYYPKAFSITLAFF